MKTNQKTLEYYINLQYDLIVARTVDDEFGYIAYCKELDKSAFYGVGDTREEAIASFEEVRSELIPYFYENDLPIPEPEVKKEALPSGKFVVRISPYTHQKIIDLALEHGVSLNSMVSTVLTEYTTSSDMVARASEELKKQVCSQLEKLEQSWNHYLKGSSDPNYRIGYVEAA